GQIQCVHPYWPENAIAEGLMAPGVQMEWAKQKAAGLARQLVAVSQETLLDCIKLAERAGRAVDDGYWSVDILLTKNGLYVTDMADGERSWHWPECKEIARIAPAK
ncbi:MAG: hypothetical protein ABIG68_09760, partial [Acidobacteriota bacterium]